VPAGVTEQENDFFAALQSAATYTIDGNTLEMRDGDDALAIMAARELNIAVPTPEQAAPTGHVTAANGLVFRSGPGTDFPVLGLAPFGFEGEIIGRSADSRWWVVAVPSAPRGNGWASADFVAARDAGEVPIIAAPPASVPVPPPAPTPVPTPVPVPTFVPPTSQLQAQIAFWAHQTTTQQGQCTTIQWSVENVQAVWVYPLGRPCQQYPRTGQGSEQVCPPATTTYERRVGLSDGSITLGRVTVNLIPAAPAPTAVPVPPNTPVSPAVPVPPIAPIPPQNPLNGTAWTVTGFNNGRGAVTGPHSGTTLTARFGEQQISGSAGCNNFFGTYSVSGSYITIQKPGTGMMFCSEPPEIMEQVHEYLAGLTSSASFRFDGDGLEFRRWDGVMTVVYSRLQ